MRSTVLGVAVLLALATGLRADEPPPKTIGARLPDEVVKQAGSPQGDAMPQQSVSDIVHSLIWLGFGQMILTGAAIGAVVYLAKIGKLSPGFTFKAICLLFLTGMAAFLVVAGYSDNQMGAAMGVIGAFGGYIFGKTIDKGEERANGHTAAAPPAAPAAPATPPPPPPPA